MSTGFDAGFPPPQNYRSMEDWAKAVYEYATSGADATAAVDPQPVLLPHQTTDTQDGVGARATQDGILMFDPVSGAPVISIGGVWKELSIVP